MKEAPASAVTASYIADLERRVARGCVTVSILPLDDFRDAYLGELADLHARLVADDPNGTACFDADEVEAAEWSERADVLRDLADGGFADDAELAALALAIDYFTERAQAALRRVWPQ